MAQGHVAAQFLVFPAGPADAEDLARVHVAAWRETYRGLLPDTYLARMSEAAHVRRFAHALLRPQPEEVTLAVGDRSGIVGYLQGGPSRRGRPGEAEIATLYLVRAAQGRGLGRRLIEAGARALVANGAASLVISVLRDNAPACRFYEHLGGQVEPPRLEPGPGGERVWEVAYHWPDIRALIA